MLGISAQGYYKHNYSSDEVDILSASIVLYCIIFVTMTGFLKPDVANSMSYVANTSRTDLQLEGTGFITYFVPTA